MLKYMLLSDIVQRDQAGPLSLLSHTSAVGMQLLMGPGSASCMLFVQMQVCSQRIK